MKRFKVAGIFHSRAVLGIPAVVLIAEDGEAWEVHTAYHKQTMEPIRVGDVVEVPLRRAVVPVTTTEAAGWSGQGYECPRALTPAPARVVAETWPKAEPPFCGACACEDGQRTSAKDCRRHAAPKPKGCEACDCADPTTVVGLATDCDCRCHDKARPKQKPKAYDVVGAIVDYEGGDLDEDGVLTLFSHLIRTGQAWTLQGSYGRAAARLIECGIIERGTGKVLRRPSEEG